MTMALWVTKSRCKSCTFRWVKYSNCWVFKGGVFLPIIIETACLTGKMKQQLQTIFLKWSGSCINAEWFSRNELQRSKNERKWMRESAIKRKAFISKEQCQNSNRIWNSSAEYGGRVINILRLDLQNVSHQNSYKLLGMLNGSFLEEKTAISSFFSRYQKSRVMIKPPYQCHFHVAVCLFCNQSINQSIY